MMLDSGTYLLLAARVVVFMFQVDASLSDLCSRAIGIQDGRIQDHQMFSAKAYDDDMSKYGPSNARLMKTSPPQGYRGDVRSPKDSWILVNFEKNLVITAIATQGYGNPSFKEWVTRFSLLYSVNGQDFKPLRDSHNDVVEFIGNNDSSSVHRQEIPVPVVASQISILPSNWSNNVGLRVELYGCEPDFYITVMLMLRDRPFTINYLNNQNYDYVMLKEEALTEAQTHWETVRGFLEIVFKGFSPQLWQSLRTLTAVELDVYCLESTLPDILAKTKEFIKNSYIFDSHFYHLRYSRRNPLCFPPNFHLIPEDKKGSRSISIFRGASPSFSIVVKHNCSTNPTLFTSCLFAAIDETTGRLTSFVPASSPNMRKVTLASNAYRNFRLVYFQCSGDTPGHEGNFAQDYRIITIVEGKLIAKIKGSRHAIKGGNSLTLDGSGSHVQTKTKYLDAINMYFSWYCRMKKVRDMRTDFKSMDGKANEVRSCFNSSMEVPISKNQTLKIDNKGLVGGASYVFKLVIKANGLVTSLKHRVAVEKFTALSINCLSNCFKKINPHKKQVFRTECNGGACQKLKTYHWSFYLYDRETKKYKPKRLWENSTSNYEGGIVFSIDDFQQLLGFQNEEDEKYKIRLVASIDAYTYVSSQEKYFILNAIPRHTERAGCVVNPREGIAMKTYFNISCEKWEDPDLPLSYKFMYLSELGMIFLESGGAPKVTTKLLSGDKESDFMIEIIVVVTDVFGVSATVRLDVKVHLPSEMVANSIIHNIDNKLDDLLRTGNSEEATDQSLFVLSLLDVFKKNPEADAKTKDDILNQMSKVKVNTMSQASKFGGLAKSATKQETKLSHKAQSNALALIESTSNAMASYVVKNSSDLNLETVQLFSESLIEGVSNVLNSSLENSSIVLTSKEGDGIEAQEGIQITRKSTEVIKNIANSLTSLVTVGDGPRVVRSKSVVVRVERNTPSSFDKKIIRDQERIEIILPSSSDVLSNTNSTPKFISCQMLEYPVNPYYWHASSAAVKSAVADISLQNEDNEILKVSSLKTPISIILEKNHISKHELDTGTRSESPNPKHFLKPPTNESDNMRFHTIFLPSSYVTLTLHLIPKDNRLIEVFVRSMERPTPFHYNYTTKIPDFSSCLDKTDLDSQKPANCSRNPYLIEITSSITGRIGLHFIGLRLFQLKPNENENENVKMAKKVRKRSINPLFRNRETRRLGEKQIGIKAYSLSLQESNLRSSSKKRSKRETSNQHGLHRRLCVRVKDPPTTPSTYVQDHAQTYNSKIDVIYQFSSSVSACMFWSEVEQQWKSDGCKLGTKSNSTHIHCLCYHMTAFGGDFFVAPNPIDFDKILFEFTHLGESENYIVMSVAFVIWFGYFIGLLFARKADRCDDRKIVSCYINHSEDTIDQDLRTYRISIQTASWIGSGTTANVGMTIYDDANSLVTLHFNNIEPEKKLFARGSVNTYFVSLPESLTDMFKITIWHDNSGSSPSWFLQDVIVSEEDDDDSKQWHFLANRWLAVDRGDNRISVDLFLAENADVKKFTNRFYTRAAKQFSNAHLWLSVFTKSVHSPFTRCQRLSCCLLVLMATMVTNAMFYQFGTKSTNIVPLGPLKVSIKGIKTGIQSSLIVLPISLLAVLIFDNVKQKQLAMDINESISVKEKVKGCIPRSFVVIAWFLCVSGALVSSVFTIFYSLMWGTDKANQWLVSMMASFLQDVFVTQPFKIIVLVSLLAMIIKKPINNHNDIIISKNQELISRETVAIPTDEEMNEARLFAESKTTSKRFLAELGLYLPLVILLFIVCYGNRDSKRFMVTNSLRNIAPNFNKVTEPKSFWKWLKEEPISVLYDVTWYNNQKFRETNGFVSNKKVFLVGMPRLRQLRVKAKSCSVDGELSHLFRRCLPMYSLSFEDTTPYSLPGWKKQIENFTQHMTNTKIDQLCPKPWRYRNFKTIQTLPFYGIHTLYGGGGYVADLGYDKWTAEEVVDSLRDNNWIDEYTAAVFFEFTVFNPSSALFSSVRYLFERFSSGSLNAVIRIDTLTVYSPTNKAMNFFLQVCQFLMMVIILVTVACEVIRIIRQGPKYLKQIWNWVQWIEVIFIVIATAMFYLKEKYVGKFIARLKANPFETSSTDYIIMWSEMETFVLSFVIFVVTIKLLRLIRFSKSVYQLHRTILQSIKMLGSLFQLFLVIMIALSFMATKAFGNFSSSFSSFIKSFIKLLHLLAGGKLFQKDSSFSESPLGLAFVIFYTFLNTFLLVNVLLSVIMESFAASKSSTDPEVLENAKVSDFTKKYIRRAFSNKKKILSKFINSKKPTPKKLYKTKRDNDKKYIYSYHSIDSTKRSFDDVEFREARCKKTTKWKAKLCDYHAKSKISKELVMQFDSIPAHEEPNDTIVCDDDDYYYFDEVEGGLAEIISILRSITNEGKA